jgi:hypothetical protein
MLKDEVAFYEIHIAGKLESYWSQWFDGLQVIPSGEETVIRGMLPDQSALFGVLAKVRDLGLILLSLKRTNQHHSS